MSPSPARKSVVELQAEIADQQARLNEQEATIGQQRSEIMHLQSRLALRRTQVLAKHAKDRKRKSGHAG